MMHPITALFLMLALSLACGPRAAEDRSGLRVKPLGPVQARGWARLALDGEAQRAREGLWLGDAAGHSVPFLVERDGLWESRELGLERCLLGRDSQGRPSVDFALRLPEGWRERRREDLELTLRLEPEGPGLPWVCRVEAERRPDARAGYLRYEPKEPWHLFDLGQAGKRDTLRLPWDAFQYRLSLVPLQGQAPRMVGLAVRASTFGSSRGEEIRVEPQREERGQGVWDLRLPEADRVVGLDVVLAPPAAPLSPEILVLDQREDPQRPGRTETFERPLSHPGLIWNLPALESRATRLELEPLMTNQLRLRLPEGARLESVQVRLRREVLLFPAEAGAWYGLHLGGRAKPAPGSLAALPDRSADLYTRAPLTLGSSQPDPFGLPRKVEGPNPLKTWLPWMTGASVLSLAAIAWRLLKGDPKVGDGAGKGRARLS